MLWRTERGRIAGSTRQSVVPLNRRTPFDRIGPAGATLPPAWRSERHAVPRHGASPIGDPQVRRLARYLPHLGCESAALVALVTA